jgi:hypothetical protein
VLFKVPHIQGGSVSVGPVSCPVIDGIVDVPEEIGESQPGWHKLRDDEIEALPEELVKAVKPTMTRIVVQQ